MSEVRVTEPQSQLLQDWRKEVEKDNEDRTLVKAEWLRKAEVEEVLIEGVDLLKKVRESKAKDDEVAKAVEEIK